MRLNDAWKSCSNGDTQVFDHRPPTRRDPQKQAEAKAAMIAALENNAPDSSPPPGWLALLRRLPPGLHKTLVAELAADNQIAMVSSTGWPHRGSVIVTMQERFTAGRHAPGPGVTWTEVNVPHYWREEMCETSAGTEFMLIT